MSVEIQRTEVVLNNRGARGTSGLVLVSSATGQAVSSRMGLAAISSPAAGQVAFLTETGREGMFAFDSSDLTAAVGADPAQAIYVAPASATSGISGAWVRRYQGAASAKWFGAVGDGTTNDATALQRCLDYGGHLYIPAAEYFSSTTLILRKNVILEGQGYGFEPQLVDATVDLGYDDQPGSRIRFAAGVGGLDIQTWSTQTDETASIVYSQQGSMYSVIRNLALIGAGTGATATGLYARTLIHLENVHVRKFQGKGFDISASAGPGADPSAEYGNASLSTITKCHAIYNGSHGFHIRGVDANVIKLDSCYAQLNGGAGFLDDGFLGNAYINCGAATNTAGSFKATNVNAQHSFVACYVEVGTGSTCDIGSPCVVTGGNLSGYAINDNTATNGKPNVFYGGTVSVNNYLMIGTAQSALGAIAGKAYIYRGGDTGLVMHGAGGTYSVTIKNASDNPVLQFGNTTATAYFAGAIAIAGQQVLTTRQAAPAAPVGGTTADVQARAAISSILSVLGTHGLIG